MSTAPVRVISFYTEKTPYEQEIVHLKNSCDQLGIPIEITPLPSEGSWEKNVAQKPRFIYEKLCSCSTPLLWVDADAVFLKEPDFSLFAQVDFSVRFMQIFQNNPQYALNAGTLFVNQTEAARILIAQWVAECGRLSHPAPPPFVDQISLYNVLLKNQAAKVLPMPVSYCKIFDMDQFFIDDAHVIIEQRQASRKWR